MKVSAKKLKETVDPSIFYSQALEEVTRVKPNGWGDGGLCPFHYDRQPGSFKVNIQTGAFKCFSCNASGGDVIDFICLKDKVEFREALKILSRGYRR